MGTIEIFVVVSFFGLSTTHGTEVEKIIQRGVGEKKENQNAK